MQIDETAGSVRLVFRPSGWLRVLVVAFLAFWLCGWAVGEWFALRLVIGAMHGGVDSQAAKVLTHPAGWAVGGFILTWLLFWTFGGLAALVELLRIVAGRDELTILNDEYVIWRGVGPFGLERRFRREQLRELYVRRKSRDLVIEAGSGRHVVTRGVTIDDRHAIEARFALSSRDTLPLRWNQTEEEGGIVCIEARAFDGPGCLVAVGMLFAASALFVIFFAKQLPTWGTLIAALIALLLGTLFLRGAFQRRQWLVGRDRFALRYRWLWHTRVIPVDERSLRVEQSCDSDGDETTALVASVNGRPRTMHSDVNEDRDVVGLARFIEVRSGWSIPIPPELRRGSTAAARERQERLS